MGDAAEFFARQDTALVVRVPEAEHAVGAWRLEHDSSAALGVPAHVTVLFPWKPNRAITDEDLESLDTVCSRFEPFDAVFTAIEDRGDVIWMRPEPEQPFRNLTTAVWERWPEHPPYEGRFDDVIPHLTIADGELHGLSARIESSVGPHLPIRTPVNAIDLLAFEAGRWTTHRTFELG
jgi:2'-5' RNA ligase